MHLVDDSRIAAKEARLLDGRITVSSTAGEELQLTSKAVRYIRWSDADETLDRQWSEILGAEASADRLVIRRSAGTLDYLPGVVQGVSDGKVQFQYEGDTIPVPLAKVDGIIFFQSEAELPSARYRLATTDGSLWNLESLELKGDVVHVTAVSGVAADLPLTRLQQIDFAQMDAVYLSDLEPSSTDWTPYIGSSTLLANLAKMFQPRRDRAYNGSLLRLSATNSSSDEREYDKGLAIHSRTEIVYRLAGKYRQFQAEVGIDPDSPAGSAVVVISADGRTLFEQEVSADQAPQSISVDVNLAKRLTILVDFGNNLDIADRVHLCDARLIK